MNKFMIAALSGLLATTAAPAALAQSAQPVELKGDVKVDKVVVENGKERHVLVEPSVVVPGDKLLFATAFQNNGTVEVKNFVVTNPIPAGVAFVRSGGDQFVVSVDGGKTWGNLAQLKVADAAGPRAAQASDVTHIRWILPVLAPGAKGSLSYNAVVR